MGEGTDRLSSAKFLVFLGHVFCRQGLIRKAHVHDARWMAFGSSEIDETAFGENIDPSSAPSDVNSSTKSRIILCANRRFLQAGQLQFHIEMA